MKQSLAEMFKPFTLPAEGHYATYASAVFGLEGQRRYTVLMISDIHLSNRLPGAKPGENGVTDRLADQIALLGRVGAAAAEDDVDAIFILGDLFDQSKVDPITLTEAVRAIVSWTKPVYILAGNHDAVNTKGGRFNVEAFGEMGNENIHYLKTGVPFRPFKKSKEDLGWLHFRPVAFCPKEEAEARIAKAAANQKPGLNVLLMHHSVMGAEHGGWVCDDGLEPETICEPFDAVFSGHFHTHAFFDKKGMYLGSPLHLRIEDEGRAAGFWKVSFYEGSPTTRDFIDGGCPRFHTLQFPVEDESKIEIKGLKKQDYVRIVCKATQTEWEIHKPKVLELEEILTGRGFRVSYQHKPVYHHSIRTVDAAGKPTVAAGTHPESAIEAYVDSETVATDGLDKKILKRIARAALEAARLY